MRGKRRISPSRQAGLGRIDIEALLARYVGFAYWDLLLYPIQALSGITELDTIEVTRVSPEDTSALEPKGTARLKGVGLAHFGAFLRRSYRENDFLWGRLDGVERLFGILARVCSENDVVIDPRLMWRGFKAVLDAEAPDMRSGASKRLLASVRAQLEHRLADAEEPPGPEPMAEAAD
jgi:Protein of unknown function (DUF3376)